MDSPSNLSSMTTTTTRGSSFPSLSFPPFLSLIPLPLFRKIVVSLPSPVAPNGEFSLRTVSVCSPNDKTLEGMYFDFTPEGNGREEGREGEGSI